MNTRNCLACGEVIWAVGDGLSPKLCLCDDCAEIESEKSHRSLTDLSIEELININYDNE